ncbi:MAG: hypothetical protein ACT4OS_00370 [Acidimicrobiales bacterium]
MTGRTWERKRSHLLQLRARLDEAALGAAETGPTCASGASGRTGGIRHRRNTAPFRGARTGDVDPVERLLLDLVAEHRSHRLDCEADEALQLMAWLAVATHSYDRFVPAAKRLRADWWIPVDAMGEAANKAGRPDLAAEVYGAAIAGGGWHADPLARLCQQRTGGTPTAPRAPLRLVE